MPLPFRIFLAASFGTVRIFSLSFITPLDSSGNFWFQAVAISFAINLII